MSAIQMITGNNYWNYMDYLWLQFSLDSSEEDRISNNYTY
jgi:hypothetical protein